MNIEWLFGAFIVSYFLGSIPFGLIITRLFGAGDLRSIGSGNIGATNVMRTGRKGLAVITLLLDLLKGVAAVKFTAYVYNSDYAILGGLIAVLGHIFPVWLRFKGGKGVATTIGVFFALNWMFALTVCAVWLCVFFITRFSSLAAILSISFSPMLSYMFDGYLTALLCFGLTGIIILSHWQNLERLLSGTELSFRRE